MPSFITSFSDSGFATNAPVVLTLPATFGVIHALQNLQASYSSGGVGDVFVEINGVEVFRSKADFSVNASWGLGLQGLANQSLVVTLDAGGPFVDGSLRISGFEV
jgi:hypothetical protein